MKPSTTTLIVSATLNAILLILLFKGCNDPCPEGVITKQYTDTIWRDIQDVRPMITAKVPEVYKIIPAHSTLSLSPANGLGSVYPGAGRDKPGSFTAPAVVGHEGGFSNPQPFTGVSAPELAIYHDTVEEKNAYRAIILDTLQQNRITGRSIMFWNLSPEIVQHIEKTTPLKEKVRLYAGAFAGFQVDYKTKQFSNWSIGPSLTLTIPQGLSIGYGFDAKNNGHLVNLQYKIKLKK